MKRHIELLFFVAVIAVLAVICFLMPKDGISFGGWHDASIPFHL